MCRFLVISFHRDLLRTGKPEANTCGARSRRLTLLSLPQDLRRLPQLGLQAIRYCSTNTCQRADPDCGRRRSSEKVANLTVEHGVLTEVGFENLIQIGVYWEGGQNTGMRGYLGFRGWLSQAGWNIICVARGGIGFRYLIKVLTNR